MKNRTWKMVSPRTRLLTLASHNLKHIGDGRLARQASAEAHTPCVRKQMGRCSSHLLTAKHQRHSSVWKAVEKLFSESKHGTGRLVPAKAAQFAPATARWRNSSFTPVRRCLCPNKAVVISNIWTIQVVTTCTPWPCNAAKQLTRAPQQPSFLIHIPILKIMPNSNLAVSVMKRGYIVQTSENKTTYKEQKNLFHTPYIIFQVQFRKLKPENKMRGIWSPGQ